MSAVKWLSLPIGTKVRMKSDWEILIRISKISDDKKSAAFVHEDGTYWYYSDDEWELIEEEPKQGDEIEMFTNNKWNKVKLVCLYKWNAIFDDEWYIITQPYKWRFPPKKIDVTLQEIADWKWVEKELINIIN